MNSVTITKCIDCSAWFPADSYGDGTFCDELGEIVSDDSSLIPDVCPKLGTEKISTKRIEINNAKKLADDHWAYVESVIRVEWEAFAEDVARWRAEDDAREMKAPDEPGPTG